MRPRAAGKAVASQKKSQTRGALLPEVANPAGAPSCLFSPMALAPLLCRSALAAVLFAAPLRGMLDRNRDGISDLWAAAHPTAGAPDADPDGDGATNLDEARAGTEPMVATSRFAAVAGRGTAGDVSLRWHGEPGKHYRVETSLDLRNWSAVPGAYVGAGAAVSALVREAGAVSIPRGFWRVAVADADADRDGLDDSEEARLGTSPNETDTDHDGLPDAWEAAFAFDATVADADADTDGDGVTNATEFAGGTDPTAADRLAPFPADAAAFPGAGVIPFFWRAEWYVQNWIGCRDGFWDDRVADHGKAVLLGDSITQFWWTSADDFAFPTANRGIMGDFTRGILFRLQTDVLDLDPPAISLLIGTNDLSAGLSPETIATNIAAILDRIEAWTQTRMMAGKPRVAVVVNLVMPRGNAEPENDVRPAVAELNRRIVDVVAGRPRTAVCDSWSIYADADGFPDPAEFTDLLHPEGAVYPRWQAAIIAAFASIGYPN